MMSDKRLFTKGIIKVGVVFLLIIAAAVFLLTTSLENVEVSGNTYYSDEEIKEKVFNKATDFNTYLFLLRNKFFDLDDIPLVEKIEVECIDGNSVSLRVYEKKIAGCAQIMGQYICFDRYGVVSDCSTTRPPDAPLIRGVDFKTFTLGSKLETTDEGIYDKIMELTTLLQKNNLNAEEIIFDFRDEITIKIDDDEILLGKKDYYDLEINNLHNIMNSVGDGSFRFDLRYMDEDNMSVTAKEITQKE